MAPAAMVALRSKRAMIIVSSSLYAFRFKVVAADPAPAPVKSAFIAAPFSFTWPAGDTQTSAFPLSDPAQKNSSKTATVQQDGQLHSNRRNLAGPEPGRNPRIRDKGVEIRSLLGPVRIQPHLHPRPCTRCGR
jgi:hypothetical protein